MIDVRLEPRDAQVVGLGRDGVCQSSECRRGFVGRLDELVRPAELHEGGSRLPVLGLDRARRDRTAERLRQEDGEVAHVVRLLRQ